MPPFVVAGVVTCIWCVLFLPLPRALFGAAVAAPRSLLELVWAGNLASKAAEEARVGNGTEAVRLAREALSRNPGSATANRTLIDCLHQAALRHEDLNPREVRTAVRNLLAASQDPTDLYLALKASIDIADHEYVIDTLRPRLPGLDVKFKVLLLDALSCSDRLLELEESDSVRTLLQSPTLPSELSIYRTALLAAQPNLEGSDEAWQQIVRAGSEGEYSASASRLLLELSRVHGNVSMAREALFRLRTEGDDSLRDHLCLWQTLLKEGRNDEVKLLVQNRPRPARTTRELVAAVETAVSQGLFAEALELEQEGSGRGLDDGRGVLACLRGLCLAGRKQDVRMVETHITTHTMPAAAATLLDSLMQGILAEVEGRTDRAAAAYRRLLELAPSQPVLALEVARCLLAIHEPARAELLAQRVEWELRDQLDYWRLRQETAFIARDPTALMHASRRALALSEKDGVSQANEALGQVVDNLIPESPLERTLHAVSRHPDALKRELFRALTCAGYAKGPMAMESLARLPEEKLASDEQQLALFARCAAFDALGNVAERNRVATNIQVQALFPSQRQWLSQLPGTSSSRAGNLSSVTATPTAGAVEP